MNDKTAGDTLKVPIEKRILNEFGAKILNEERLEKVIQSRRGTRNSEHADMLFACECDDKECSDTILMSTEEYKHVHRQTKHFIVIPSHVRLDLEEIITAFAGYTLVAKFFPGPASKG